MHTNSTISTSTLVCIVLYVYYAYKYYELVCDLAKEAGSRWPITQQQQQVQRWRVPGGRFHNNNNILSSTTLASSMYSMHIYIYI